MNVGNTIRVAVSADIGLRDEQDGRTNGGGACDSNPGSEVSSEIRRAGRGTKANGINTIKVHQTPSRAADKMSIVSPDTMPKLQM